MNAVAASEVPTVPTPSARSSTPPMILVEDAVKYFPVPRKGLSRQRSYVHAVDGVSLRIEAGQSVGLVGESGSGKSTLARIILGLLRMTSGTVIVDGIDTTKMSGSQHKSLCRTAQLVFQDPHAALDPRMTLAECMAAVLSQHKIGSKQNRRQLIIDAFNEVGLDASFLDRYAGACSGGQVQRVVIARALLLDPKVLICDEPTSALDASVQANILNLLTRLRSNHHLTMLMISHDLRVIRFTSDRVAVLYLGQLVEVADRDELFEHTLHPYTLAMLNASATAHDHDGPQLTAYGEPPSPVSPPPGCRYNTRCPLAVDQCRTEAPQLTLVAPAHGVRCHRWEEVARLRNTRVSINEGAEHD